MILIGLLLLYLAIAKKFEPLLLVTIGFGGILSNIPGAEIATGDGLLHMVYVVGIETGAFPLMLVDELDLSFTDAFFESVSGITTTGATVITGLKPGNQGSAVKFDLVELRAELGAHQQTQRIADLLVFAV